MKINKSNVNFIILALICILLGVVGFCAYKFGEVGRKTIHDKNISKRGTSTEVESKTNMPWVFVDTLQDVEKKLGFTIEVPTQINNLSISHIGVIADLKIVEVSYIDEKTKSDEDKKIYIRKMTFSAPSDDYSLIGMYDTVTNTKKVDNIILSMNGDVVYLAEWEENNYRYSVYMPHGMVEEDFLKVVKEVK